MSAPTQENLRLLSHEDLLSYIARWRDGTEQRISGEFELRRRERTPTLIVAIVALAISGVSILVALAALLFD